MRLRNRFALFFVTFAVAISACEGWLSYNASRRALETELDRRLLDVAGVAGDLSFRTDDALLLLGRGDEDKEEWIHYHTLLLRLRNEGYVDRADIFRWDPGDRVATVLVSVDPPDVLSIGQELNEVGAHIMTVEEAYHREDGRATSELFESADGKRQYKYGFVRLGSGRAFLGVLIPADHLEPLTRLGWTVVGVSVGAAVLAALIGWRLAGGIASRLEVLSPGRAANPAGLDGPPLRSGGRRRSRPAGPGDGADEDRHSAPRRAVASDVVPRGARDPQSVGRLGTLRGGSPGNRGSRGTARHPGPGPEGSARPECDHRRVPRLRPPGANGSRSSTMSASPWAKPPHWWKPV